MRIDVDCNDLRTWNQPRCGDGKNAGARTYVEQAISAPMTLNCFKTEPRSLVRSGAKSHARIDLNDDPAASVLGQLPRRRNDQALSNFNGVESLFPFLHPVLFGNP